MNNLPQIPLYQNTSEESEPCCGPPQLPPGSPYERPGYELCPYVDDFIETEAGIVPLVATKLSWLDTWGSVRVRLGIRRNYYKVAAGLYGVGKPDPGSPVLVTANYKLTFDSLRKELAGVNIWILVLDTRGVNVWCAAGKQTFSTAELVRRVRQSGLKKVVNHRQLILPQLGAPGVSYHQVKKECGFEVRWGPVYACDLREFLSSGKANEAMREVSFSTLERVVLIPVELSMLIKPSIKIVLALLVLSGINRELYSLTAAWQRGQWAVAFLLLGIISGAILVPLLLPWLPSRKFYLKGIITGLITGVGWVWLQYEQNALSVLELAGLLLFCVVISSYAAMNFTGATPYTSPSGVEKEMRQGIPIQLGMVMLSLVCWLAAPFLR